MLGFGTLDIGTISLILLIGIFVLLAIGMPLGFASGFLAVVVMVLRFLPRRPCLAKRHHIGHSSQVKVLSQ